MPFEKFLRSIGVDPDSVEKNSDTEKALRKAYDLAVKAESAAATSGEEKKRAAAIMNTARAAALSATPAVKAGVLEHAAELVSDEDLSVADAQRKLAEKIADLIKDDSATRATATADEQRTEVSVPADREAVLSKRDILSVFGQERSDRAIYDVAARSVVDYIERGEAIPASEIFAGLEGKTGRMIVHDESGRGSRRSITAASANVAIQAVMNHLLQKSYQLRPDRTDALVTTIPGGANEITFPEVEADAGVKRLKEGEAYPLLGTTERDVKSSYVKYGAAISQTRENSVFDKLGRVTVLLQSLARQLQRYRAEFRLARICDSTTLDGRYIARPDNDSGSAAFYSSSEDARGNVNLKTSNGLSDETDLANVRDILDAMVLLDGSSVLPEMRVILVDSTKHETAWKILNTVYAPSITSANTSQIKNPYGPEGMYETRPTVISHPKVSTYAGAATTWFAGDPQQQFYEIEHWPVEMVPVVASGDMLLRDIVSAWKGSFCIDVIALSNMYFVKNTA